MIISYTIAVEVLKGSYFKDLRLCEGGDNVKINLRKTGLEKVY
jgi:hypothetical protein